ncbi:hypothetical protein D9M69_600990 [compost metagenome]
MVNEFHRSQILQKFFLALGPPLVRTVTLSTDVLLPIIEGGAQALLFVGGEVADTATLIHLQAAHLDQRVDFQYTPLHRTREKALQAHQVAICRCRG